MKRSLLLACVAALVLNGCGSVGPDAATQTITLPGSPNGVAVREPNGTVYVTDDTTNSILASSDGGRFAPYAKIPAVDGQRNGLSQIIARADGNLFVARFGFGTSGAIVRIDPAGRVALASNVNPDRRRLGLLALNPTRFLSSWFVKKGDDAAHGGVSLITIDASTNQSAERDLVVGLGKPVGLAISDDTLFITDQANNRIVKVKLSAALSATTPVASNDIFVNVSAPDLLAAAPGGTLYTKCGEHSLCRYSRTGETTVIATDFDEPRGIAVDSVRKRLFVVDRARGAGRPSHLRILRID